MDKYEYQVCTEQIKQLISEKRFAEAMEIADTIDWRRVRSVSMLITVSEIYKVNKRYEDAKDILLLAYERHPNGRDIVYALCELFIKLGDVVQAIESYKEFMAVAPGDANSCILLYKIYKAQDVSLEEQIDVLEEYKRKDYREKWAYELASLYHKTGQEAKCVAECDELILWFGEGKYVRMAMELKMKHQALTRDQQAKFDGRELTGSMPVFEQPVQENSQFGNNAQQTGPMIDKYGEYLQQTGQMGTTGQLDIFANQGVQYDAYGNPVSNSAQQNPYGQPQTDIYGNPVQQNTYGQPQTDMYGNPVQQNAYGQPQTDMYENPAQQNLYSQPQADMYGNPVQVTGGMYSEPSQGIQVTADPGMNHLGMTQDIMVQALGTGMWNTMEMQSQLGSQVREVMQEEPQYVSQTTFNTSDIFNSQPIYQTGDVPQEIEPDSVENTAAPEPAKPVISVHTGVIDISDAELISGSLPGEPLPEEKSTDNSHVSETTDIMSKLQGVIPGTQVREEVKDDFSDGKDIAITGVSSTVNVHKTKSRITGQIPSFLPSGKNNDNEDDDVKIASIRRTGSIEINDSDIIENDSKESVYEIKEETQADEIQRISAISEKAFPGFTVPEIKLDEEKSPEMKEEASSEEPVKPGRPVMKERPVFGADRPSLEKPAVERPRPVFGMKPEPAVNTGAIDSEIEALLSPETDTVRETEPEQEMLPEQEIVPEKESTEEVVSDNETIREVPAFVSPFEEESDVPQVIQKRITSELPKVPENEKLTPVGDEEGHYPYDTVTDIGYVEELPEIEQPEDVDDILKTGKIPAAEVEKALAYETDAVKEAEEYEIADVDEDDEDDDEGQLPTFMRGDIRARREFDDSEYRIFCRYDGMEPLKAQLVDAMDTMSMNPQDGNIVIMGPESVDCKGIAISLVKAMQSKNPYFSGKVAKISGEALNRKNIKGTLEKLENGALVVERAGGLTRESVILITETLSDSNKPILVIFEGQKEDVKPLFKYSKQMKTVFNARIDIAEFTDEDLVNYGRGYALEKEYSIDDMGGLALHNRISEMQTFNHSVTTDEVREIIDMAIEHVDKRNMGHFMDYLLGRRYDDEDNIILSEKDFIF